MASDQHFSLKCFQGNLLKVKYFQSFQACFGHSECEWFNKIMQHVFIQSHTCYIEVNTINYLFEIDSFRKLLHSNLCVLCDF